MGIQNRTNILCVENLSKVAKVTAVFWVTKILATTLGETGGDFIAQTSKLGYATATAIFLTFFAITLGIQLSAKKFNPWIYWGVILSTSTAGTTISDLIDRDLHLGYATGSAILVGILVAILIIWRLSTGTLSVESVTGGKQEVFYWIAILASNTLGTALGDFLADSSGLGFAGSAGLITGVLVLILILHLVTKLDKVWLFWAAFVLTRPFGATFGDLLTKKEDHGGLDLGTGGSSLVLLTLLVIVVIWTNRRTQTVQPA